MKLCRIIVWGILTTAGTLSADNRIVMYLKHAPQSIINSAEKIISKKLLKTGTPGEQAKELLDAKITKPALGGIAAIYGGYFTISRADGLISFPLRHATPKVYVAITPSIQLVRIRGNTFSHRAFLPPPTPTVLFSLEQTVDDKKRTYWCVKEEALPDDLVVSPLTIVLLTEPNNIVIPSGDFLAAENQQLILPEPILVSRDGNDACLFNALTFKQHFENIDFEDKKASDNCTQTMIQNI